MQKAEFAFFGGPYHGRVVEVAEDYRVIHAPVPLKSPILFGAFWEKFTHQKIESVTYCRRSIEGVTVFGRLHRLDVFIAESVDTFDPYDSNAMLARAFVTCSLDHTAGLQFRVRDPRVAMHMVLTENENDQMFSRLCSTSMEEYRNRFFLHVWSEIAAAKTRKHFRKSLGGKP